MKKIILGIVLIVLLFSLCSCTNGGAFIEYNNRIQGTNFGYEIMYIEGMPCMRIGRVMDVGNDAWSVDGVTCDWSQWDGNK
jgi:hypothetical protein